MRNFKVTAEKVKVAEIVCTNDEYYAAFGCSYDLIAKFKERFPEFEGTQSKAQFEGDIVKVEFFKYDNAKIVEV